MKRRTGVYVLIPLFIAALGITGYAQQTSKIGVVNSQQVLEESAEGKRVMGQIEERNKKLQNDLARLDEEISKLQTKLNTQRLTLTQEALANLAMDIDRKTTDRKRKGEDANREMQELTGRLLNRVQNELIPIINKLGAEMGLDIIFDLGKSGAIYFSPAINLTQEVIKRYNASKASK